MGIQGKLLTKHVSRMGMMLTNLSKRLCPFMTLAIAFGCGKKINDPKITELSRQNQNQELPSTLIIQLDESESAMTTYKMPRNAWFKLPTKIRAKQASAAGKSVKVFYNYTSEGHYEFHCYYNSAVLATELTFEKCQASDDVTIISNPDDLEKMDFPIDKDTSVKMELTNPSGSGIKLEAAYLVDWK
jgi:hypothetical protein